MSLLQQIKTDLLAERRNKEKDVIKVALLTTLVGEATMPGKNDGNRESTDQEVKTVIKKFIKNLDLALEHIKHSPILQQEKDILLAYLPKALTEEVLKDLIKEIINVNNFTSPKDMGKIMKFLQLNYSGQYDGSKANQIVKELLK